MIMETGISRRFLAQSQYISYGALLKDSIPCNVRGNSYYNCNSNQIANPYTRGCTAITLCARSYYNWFRHAGENGHRHRFMNRNESFL